MSYFWLLAILLTGVVLVLLLRPFIRRREAIEAAFTDKADLSIYRSQLDALEHDVEAETLSLEEAAAMRAEIGRRLLAAEKETPKAHFYFDPLRTAGLIVLCVTIGTVMVYAFHGAPLLPSQPFDAEAAAADPQGKVAKLVKKLEKTVQDEPENSEAWIKLALVHRLLGHYLEAAEAYSVAVGLLGTARPDLLAAYGETLVLAEEGTVTPKARRAFSSVLDYDPKDPSARYYLGLADMQDQKFAEALLRWQRLIVDLPADNPLLAPLKSQILWLDEKIREDAAAK